MGEQRIHGCEPSRCCALASKTLTLSPCDGPGRKLKNEMRAQIRPPIPELDSEEEEMLARKKHGPSLPTPQKSRILQLEFELDLLEWATLVPMDRPIRMASCRKRWSRISVSTSSTSCVMDCAVLPDRGHLLVHLLDIPGVRACHMFGAIQLSAPHCQQIHIWAF